MALNLELQTASALSPRVEARLYQAIGAAVVAELPKGPREIIFSRVDPQHGEHVRLLVHSDADTVSRPVILRKSERRRGGKKGKSR